MRCIHTVPGLEHAEIVRNAYAIEYDCINPMPTVSRHWNLRIFRDSSVPGRRMEAPDTKKQQLRGLIAGINAAKSVKGEEPLILDRSQAYIGVLIDDLVTKENHEPYRMMTSRAEYRLLLRQDNADLRLTELGYQVGLIDEARYQRLLKKKEQIEAEIQRLEHTSVGGSEKIQLFLDENGSTRIKSGISLAELVRRPELDYWKVQKIDEKHPDLPYDVCEQVNIDIKYEGYIRRQKQQVEQFRKLEGTKIPEDIRYEEVGSLRKEAIQKLEIYRPLSIGQASRISGVSPADISVLLVYLEQKRRQKVEK